MPPTSKTLRGFYFCLISVFFALVLPFSFISAQSNQDELQLMQSLYGMDKREIVDEFVDISESQQAVFWSLYDEYEVKRKDLGKKRFELINRYVNDFGEVSAADADNFMREAIQLRIKSDNLRDSYYKKVKSRTDPVVAMQFYQIESYLSDLIRIEILEEIYTFKK